MHAPAGLDLGAVDNAEIAVAVLADLVARRAAGQLRGDTARGARREAIDPVCGMTVFVDEAEVPHRAATAPTTGSAPPAVNAEFDRH